MFGASWTQDDELAAAFRELCLVLAGAEGYVAGAEAAAAPVGDALRSACLVGLLDDEARAIHTLGAHDPRAGRAAALGRLADQPFSPEGAMGRALQEVRGVAGEAVPAELPADWPADAVGDLGIGFVLAAPIRGRHQPLGLLWAGRDGETAFSDDERDFLGDCGRLVGLAVEAGFLEEALDQARGRRRLEVRPATAPPEGMPERRRSRAVLSEPELRVLRLLARGESNRTAGDLLGLSVRTVEWHRARIQWKLGVTGRGDLAAAAREQGIEDV